MSRRTLRSWVSPAVLVLLSMQPVWAQEHHLPAPANGAGTASPPPHSFTVTDAGHGAAAGPCDDCRFGGGFFLDLDFLYLQPRRRAQNFAIVNPSLAGTAIGDIESVNWRADCGYRIGGGYRIGNQGWFVGANYTYFHASNQVFLGRPAGGTLIATMTHPGFVDMVDTAFATSNINYNVLDIDIGRTHRMSDTFQASWSTGGRFAWIDQGLNAFYNGNTANNAVVTSPIEFNGAGVRAAGEAQWLFAGKFGIYGTAAGSLLAGDFRTNLYEANAGGVTVISNLSERFRKVVPVAELGIGAVYQREHARLRLGYYITNWFGMVDSPDVVHDFSNKLSYRQSDLSLDGLLVQLLLSY